MEKTEQKRGYFYRLKRKYKYGLTGFLFILPALALLGIFVYAPLIMAIYQSFFDYAVYAKTQKFVGFENYKYITNSGEFTRSMWNVAVMAIIITVLMLLLSFAFAHVIKSLRKRQSSAVKTIIYLPTLIAGITVSILFLFMTRFSGGLLNAIAMAFGSSPISFATHKIWAKVIIIVPALWMGIGYNSLVMYAALINIPKEYYEAAKMDGANWYQRLFRITVPNMRNYFVLLLVGLMAGNIQMFDLPYMLTNGGPLEATSTPVLFLFKTYRESSISPSKTYAGAVILMLIITTVNVVVFALLPSKKSEDG